MHPLLRLHNLSLLPVSYRRFATGAANGDLVAFSKLLELLSTRRDKTYTQCLPIFYANLDPAGIPKEGESLLKDDFVVSRAIMALNALRVLDKSHAKAGPDLWPRVWVWLDYLFVHREYLPGLPWDMDVRFDLLLFVQVFCTDPDTADLISKTKGVRSLMMHAWTALFDTEEGPENPGFAYLCNFLRNFMQANESDNFEEVLEGAGGSRALAALVVRHITLFIPTRDTSVDERILFFIEGALHFLYELQDSGHMSTALVSSGLVTALVTAACSIGASTIVHDDLPDLLFDIFDILEGLMDVSPSYVAVSEALSAGLLPAIISSAVVCGDSDDMESSSLWNMLDTLPGYTIYYPVAVQLELLLREAEDAPLAPAFNKLPIGKIWTQFTMVVKQRIEVLNEAMVLFKACDNMECGVIHRKEKFQRCGRCQRVYYCSPDCQKSDWGRGGHRAACDGMREFRLKHHDLGVRNLTFMRKVLHNDFWMYQYNGHFHFDNRLEFMRERPDEPLITVFDYRLGGVAMCVRFLADERAADTTGEVDWEEHISRAARSGGLMELHLMLLRDASRTRRLMMPQRSDSAVLHDGLARIFREVDPDSNGIKEIEELLEKNDVVNIH
ncbi:hypothetical protein C8R43DRAFT_1035404 [Mycena crocata]|nr:hypothetical protein C8R43DRAFT_1035404 [Mycena crocata]